MYISFGDRVYQLFDFSTWGHLSNASLFVLCGILERGKGPFLGSVLGVTGGEDSDLTESWLWTCPASHRTEATPVCTCSAPDVNSADPPSFSVSVGRKEAREENLHIRDPWHNIQMPLHKQNGPGRRDLESILTIDEDYAEEKQKE